MLPRGLGLDEGDEVWVILEVVEELVPVLGRGAGVPDHVPEILDAVICQGRDGFLRAGIYADDGAIGVSIR